MKELIQGIIDTPAWVWYALLAGIILLAGSWIVYELKNPIEVDEDFDRPGQGRGAT